MWPFTNTSCPGATSEMGPIDKVLDSWLLYSKLPAVGDSNVFLLITISSKTYGNYSHKQVEEVEG